MNPARRNGKGFGLKSVLACLVLASCAAPGIEGWEDPLGPASSPKPRPGAGKTGIPGTVPPSGPLSVTVIDAILIALENNAGIHVARLNPSIRRTQEQRERAAFDPVLGGQASWTSGKTERLARFGSGTESSASETTILETWIDARFPTGTSVTLEGESDLTTSSLYHDAFSSSRIGVSATQALLNGWGIGVNLASLHQARIDTRVSQYELRGFAEALVAQVEQAYWDLALAIHEVEIYRESLKLAKRQLQEARDRVEIGKLAETETAAPKAQVAVRKEDLINARSNVQLARLRMLRLLSPPGPDPWGREIVLRDRPTLPLAPLDDVESHVRLALRMRPDLNQARLAVKRDDLEIVKTRNGLLPVLDLFITLGKSGYADSFSSSLGEIGGRSYDVSAGIRVEVPLLNRRAKADHRRALLDRRRALEALRNMEQTVQLDVRSAYIEVERAREQITATRATRTLREEALRAEVEKFRVGKSTTFLVAQAERDVVASRIAEIRAVVNTQRAVIDLHRLEGALLERRGISAPGNKPVKGPTESE